MVHALGPGQARTLRFLAAALALGTWLAGSQPARATLYFGPLQLSGNLDAQNLFRHGAIDRWSVVQQRNTVRLRVEWEWLQDGSFLGRHSIPAIESSRLFLAYRGVYDSIYDFTPGIPQKTIQGNRVGTLGELSRRSRDAAKFENRLREAYVDIEFRNVPLNLRIGRQQIVWGEADNFRMLDRVNALDLTWHFWQELPFGWDELRRPYWMLKGLWDVGRLGPLRQAFVEFYWNPGDWHPVKHAFLPRPWGLPVENPIPRAFAAFTNVNRLANGTRLFVQGDYNRNPAENSQVGVRFRAVTPQGVDFTINYFWQRWAGDDGTNSAALEPVPPEEVAISEGILPAEYIAPHVHTFGASLNYFDQRFTQGVFRLETIYDLGIPFSDLDRPTTLPGVVPGVTRKDMWKGMLAMDRPTWIRALNKRSTVLLLGQFFWHKLVSPNPSLVGQLDLPIFGGNFRDTIHEWELLFTLAATTFYRGGKIIPSLIYILDPVNSYNMEIFWSLDYFLTNNLILTLSQRHFINTTDEPVFETWGLAGMHRGRSETGLRIRYQL